MQTLATAPTPETIATSTQRFKWFVRLSVTAIGLVAIPTLALQGPTLILRGFSNPYSGAFAFVYLPLSFAVWQAALVFLYLSGRSTITRRVRPVAALLAIYVLTAVGAVALFWLFPARFYD